MAPKSTQNSHMSSSTVSGTLAVGHLSSHQQPGRKHPNRNHKDSASMDGLIPPTIQGGSSCSARSSFGGDDQEAGVGGTGFTNADDEDNEDEESDALAPSYPALKGHGDQAGLNSVNDPNAHKFDSDDDAYKGIDLISNSEDGDSVLMQQEEERNIIESECDDAMPAATVPSSLTEVSDAWLGFNIEQGFFASDISQFDEQFARYDPSVLESGLDMSKATRVFEDLEPIPSRSPSPHAMPLAKVRFKDTLSYHSNSCDVISNDDYLNGLFNSAPEHTSQDTALDIQGAVIDDDVDEHLGDDGSSVGKSSGYETDYGDTTDEEDVPASATLRPQSLLRQPSLSSMDNGSGIASPAAPSRFKIPAPPLQPRRGPRMGSWTVNRTKSFAMIDSTGDNMVIVPAKRLAQAGDFSISTTAHTSPIAVQPWLARGMNENGLDLANFSIPDDDPMLPSEADVMPPTLLPTAPSSQSQEQALSSSSVFLPMDEIGNLNGVYAADNQDDYGDDDDGEDMLNVDDFIDFGDSSDDELDGDQGFLENACLPTPASTSPLATGTNLQAKTPLSSMNSAQQLLEHLDKGVIGAFRRGRPHHQAQLGRLQNGSSLKTQAFKSGRAAAALSFQSKRKLSDTLGSRPTYSGVAKRIQLGHR